MDALHPIGSSSLQDQIQTADVSDESEESEEEMVEVSDGTSTLYFHSKDGMAQCEYCGSFGVKDAFYSKTKEFCSVTCSRNFISALKEGKPIPKQTSATPIRIKTFTKPKTAKKKKLDPNTFSWDELLQTQTCHCASVKCFQHVPLADSWDVLNTGMKVEIVNKNAYLPTTVYWIASVIKLAGYKALLRYEGYGTESSHDYWINLVVDEVHPVGWCAANKKPLVPPKDIQNKHGDWKDYLVKRLTGSSTLPHNFHNSIQLQICDSPLKVGMLVEVVDKMCVSATRVATVAQVIGTRVKLHYREYPYENGTFWCDCASPLVHPVGWSALVGHKIHASADYVSASLKKIALHKYEHNEASPNLFPALLEVPETSLQFRVGMKLEAIDPLNLSAICVATVMKVLKNNYLMIGIDGSTANHGSDWFCYHASSPCIFPVGFCEVNNLQLTPPRNYKKEFKWLDYLKQTRAVAAPVKLFSREMVNHGFRVGMKLEAADLMDPRLICVATVAQVLGRLLRIHFDGWESSYDQWIDCQSPDIYPVGWCQLVGLHLEGPKASDLESVSTEEPQPAKVPKKQKHQKHALRFGKTKRKSQGSTSEGLQTPSGSPKPQLTSQTSMTHSEHSLDSPLGDTHQLSAFDDVSNDLDTKRTGAGDNSFVAIPLAQSPVKTVSHYIPRILSGSQKGDESTEPVTPHLWSVFDVCQFLRVNDCQQYCEAFKAKAIPGVAFLKMTKGQLVGELGIRVGPSLKIFDLIQALKSMCDNPKS